MKARARSDERQLKLDFLAVMFHGKLQLCRMIASMLMELYRHFDASGRLLYVGISISTTARLAGHRLRSGWFRRIARIEIQRFKTREAALQAERRAIETERPIWNVAYNVVRIRRRKRRKAAAAFWNDRVEQAYQEFMAAQRAT